MLAVDISAALFSLQTIRSTDVMVASLPQSSIAAARFLSKLKPQCMSYKSKSSHVILRHVTLEKMPVGN